MKSAKLAVVIALLLALILGVCPSVQADDNGSEVALEVTIGLTISDVRVSNTGSHVATISWETNGDASSQVFYDVESHANAEDYAHRTDEDTTLVIEHTVNLTGLDPNTTYHYRVRSAVGGFEAISPDYTFTTLTSTNSSSGGGYAAGGFRGVECYLEVDMLGEITMVRVGCCTNRALGTHIAFDPDDIHFLEIKHDMELICGACAGCHCYPQVVVMSLSQEKPSPPEGMAVVGPVYDFTGYKDLECTIPCKLATYFDPPVVMQISYDPDDLPEGAFEPVIGFYDDGMREWVTLPPDTGRVAEVGKVTGVIAYLASPFAVLVNVPPPSLSSPPPPASANFVVSGLSIEPSVREIWQPVTFMTKTGESVTITADVANDGGQEGAYIVELKINGETIDSEVVTLGAGQSEQVSFTLSGMEPGQYDVAVSGLSGEFTVQRTLNWWLIGGIIAVLLILIGWLIWYYRKKLWYYLEKLWYYIKKPWYYRKKIRPAAVLRVFRFSHS